MHLSQLPVQCLSNLPTGMSILSNPGQDEGLNSFKFLPSVAFHLQDENEDLCPLLILPTSSMQSKSLLVKSSSTLRCTLLLITREPQASVAMRAPALVAMEMKVLFYSISWVL